MKRASERRGDAGGAGGLLTVPPPTSTLFNGLVPADTDEPQSQSQSQLHTAEDLKRSLQQILARYCLQREQLIFIERMDSHGSHVLAEAMEDSRIAVKRRASGSVVASREVLELAVRKHSLGQQGMLAALAGAGALHADAGAGAGPGTAAGGRQVINTGHRRASAGAPRGSSLRRQVLGSSAGPGAGASIDAAKSSTVRPAGSVPGSGFGSGSSQASMLSSGNTAVIHPAVLATFVGGNATSSSSRAGDIGIVTGVTRDTGDVVSRSRHVPTIEALGAGAGGDGSNGESTGTRAREGASGDRSPSGSKAGQHVGTAAGAGAGAGAVIGLDMISLEARRASQQDLLEGIVMDRDEIRRVAMRGARSTGGH